MSLSDTELNAFLGRPLVAVISTVDASGRPRSAPIWFSWEEGAAYMFTSRSTLKWRNIERNPHASLCVDWKEPPYTSVIMDGPVEEVDRSIYELALSLAERYYGDEKGRAFAEDYRGDQPSVVAFRLTPRHVASFTSDD